MIEDSPSTKAQIKEALIAWGLPTLFSSFPFLMWLDAAGAFLRQLGWQFVTIGISALIFVLVRLFVLLQKERANVRVLNEKLASDFRTRLELVPGRAYYRDKVSGAIICPRCVANKNIPSPMAKEGDYYVCGACEKMISC